MLSLLAAIPYDAFTFGPIPIYGPIQIHSFGLFVAIGLFVTFTFASQYIEKTMGESAEDFQTFGMYLVIIGWISAHVIDVLFYRFDDFTADPLILFEVWGSISSFGGLFGGVLGAWIWHKRYPDKDFLRWCDLAAMTLTFSWFFGRVGCSSVHDHPGAETDFPLAIVFPDGIIRHDLGFYEAIWWFVICAVVLITSRKPRPKGFYLALVPIMYTPVRFSLDFLRVGPELGGDVRYFGLTPAQYFSIIIFCIGLYFLKRIWGQPPVEWTRYRPPVDTDDDAEEDSP